MKDVALWGTEIRTTALGFGCSALVGDRSRSDALKILNTAFDCGIRYFDVAPSYNQGLAEDVLGEFVQSHRDEVTIATKFGIEPSLPSVTRSPFIRKAARTVMNFSPTVRRLVGRASIGTLSTGRFTISAAQKSVERSLRALRTERIDVLLLHDCKPQDLNQAEDLIEFLGRLVQQGTVCSFGVGTSIDSIAIISEQYPALTRVVQFANSALIRSFQKLQTPGAVVTHGPLAGSYTALRRFLSERPEVARTWSRELDADISNPGLLSKFLLSYAMTANTRGPVVFSSRDPDRLRENASLLRESGGLRPPQVSRFAELTENSGLKAV